MDSLSSVTQITVRTMRYFLKMGNHSETKMYYSIIDVGTHHNSNRGNETYLNFKLGMDSMVHPKSERGNLVVGGG